MAGIANGEATGGREKSGDDRGGETAVAGERGELLVEQTDELFLIEAIHEAAHQRAQIGCGGGYRLTVAGNIGEQQAGDAAGDATGSELAAAPDFHALHVLRGGIRHTDIIRWLAGAWIYDADFSFGLASCA